MKRNLLAGSILALFPVAVAAEEGADTRAPLEEEAKAVVAEKDRDGDGRLNSAELGAGDRLFRLLDRDRDGFLRAEDLLPPRPRRGPGGEGGEAGGFDRLRKMFKEGDANGDGKIERAEWKGPAEAFDRYDADKDGAISKEEARSAADKFFAGRGGRGKAGEALFRNADKDGDGKITREEWPLRPEAFDRLDANGDGVVTADEAATAGPRKGEGRGGDDASHFLGRHDANRDGKVTKEEFPNETRFAEIDADGDGVLSVGEVEEAMAKRRNESGYGFSEKYDLNGDGKVSREEFTGPAAEFEKRDANHDGVIDGADQPAEPKPDAR
ncbi:MAG: EF-hand domain-containing protein [Planctomycetota bacterium]